MAATWSSHAATATPIPIANHLERKSPAALRAGWSQSTSGARFAPRCL